MNEAVAKDVFHQAVMWRGVEMLPRLRTMQPAERIRVMNEANEHNSSEPLWLAVGERKFVVPSWDSKPITGTQVTALIVFGIWAHVGEREEAAPSLVENWPELKAASQLEALGANRTAEAICT